MANPNDPQNYGRETRQETYNNTDGHTHISKTTETVNSANTYKDGYVNGQVDERYQEDALASRDNENAGRGLLIGILLASLAALTAGCSFPLPPQTYSGIVFLIVRLGNRK